MLSVNHGHPEFVLPPDSMMADDLVPVNAAASFHMFFTAHETKGFTLEEMDDVFDSGVPAWKRGRLFRGRLFRRPLVALESGPVTESAAESAAKMDKLSEVYGRPETPWERALRRTSVAASLDT